MGRIVSFRISFARKLLPDFPSTMTYDFDRLGIKESGKIQRQNLSAAETRREILDFYLGAEATSWTTSRLFIDSATA